MNKATVAQQAGVASFLPFAHGILQRKYVSNNRWMAEGQSNKTKPWVLQTKLTVNEPGDSHEQEADRIVDLVTAAPVHHAADSPLRVQRFAGQPDGQLYAAPLSVDRALDSPGRALEPSLRLGMEQRFGYDFSGVRVHTGVSAEQSARDVSAHAYTVGHNIVFGEGQYSPDTLSGQRLLTHELVHTLQQSGSARPPDTVQRRTSLDIALRSPGVAAQVPGSELLDGFELNSHTLTARHKRRLLAFAKRLMQLLREHPSGFVEITGHTDATGEEAMNERLGQDRADAVAAFLRKAGVPAEALLTKSAGESALRVPTGKAEPRNRRVEIRLLPEPAAVSPAAAEPETGELQEAPVRFPGPENLCAEHPEICDPITNQPEVMPSCRPANCSAYGVSFDDQPPDLQLLLTKSFGTEAAPWFRKLNQGERMALKGIFNRLCRYGLWCHVRHILKTGPGEAPVLLADLMFDVAGRTPSVYFTSPSGNSLYDALMATGRFCQAHGAGASEHKGQTTLREISGSDSLHVSIGPGDQFDAHIDVFSSVQEHPRSSFCSNEPTPDALRHIGREVVPEKVRSWVEKLTRWMKPIGPLSITRELLLKFSTGFQVFPDFELTPTVPRPAPENRPDAVPPPIAGITWRGPRSKPKQPLVSPEAKGVSPNAGVLSGEVVEGIRQALEEQVSSQALLPSPVRVRLTEARKGAEMAGPDEEAALRAARESAENKASEYADAHDVAFDIAVRMEQARRGGRAWVKLELDNYGSYGGLDGNSRKAIVGEIRRIALILRNYLPDRAVGVNTVVIIFGKENMAVREEIRLPGWVERKKGLFE